MEIKKKDLIALVQQEIEKNAIHRAVEQAEPPKVRWQDVLRHPLFLAVFAFMLTTVVGTYVEGRLNSSAVERDRIENLRVQVIKEELDDKQVVDEFLSLASKRWAVMALLRSSLKRRNAAEVERHMERYTDVYFEWNEKRAGIDLKIREMVAGDDEIISGEQTIFERTIATAIDSNFAALHGCFLAIRERMDDGLTEEEYTAIELRSCGAPREADRARWASPAWRRLSMIDRCKLELATQLRRKIRNDGLRKLGRVEGLLPADEFDAAQTAALKACKSG